MIDKANVEAVIAVIVTRAPALIAAGVTELTLEGFTVRLAPPPPAKTDAAPAKPVPRAHPDPLQDPATFPGGRMRGFKRDEDKHGG
jgi:hypothetical protein